MKKILITGGSGLLGQYLNLTVSKKFKIHTTYKSNPGNCREFSSSKIDIRNENDLGRLFKEFQPDIVIHAAAITNPVLKENQTTKDYFDTNVTATRRLQIFVHNIIQDLFTFQRILFMLVTEVHF